MPINSISAQPGTNTLNAAYRPIIYQVIAPALPPIVFCDIYLNGTYYRSVSRTQPLSNNGTTSEWQFDIQDACQEYLRKRLGSNGGSVVTFVPEAFATVFCKFRGSTIDSNGFTVPDGAIPVQATGTLPPTAGGGTSSGSSYVLNATLQHESNQNLATHLQAFQTGTWTNAYPLTHRPGGLGIGYMASSYFPIFYNSTNGFRNIKLFYRSSSAATYANTLYTLPLAVSNPFSIVVSVVNNGNGTQTVTFTFPPLPATVATFNTIAYSGSAGSGSFAGNTTSPVSITIPVGSYLYTLTFTNNDTSTTQVFLNNTPAIAPIDPGVYYIPDGPKNLAGLFPTVVWKSIYDYFIQVIDSSGNIVATSPVLVVSRCEPGEGLRLHFLNYLGTFDSFEFLRPRIKHEDEGDEYVKGLPVGFIKSDSELNRWDVRANDTIEVFAKCRERDMDWLKELADSPAHYQEWTGIEGQADSYLPLIKQKGAFDSLKNDGSEFQYQYEAVFVKGNGVITIRG